MSRTNLASQGDGSWHKRYEDIHAAGDHETMRALSDAQVQQFIEDGFIRIDRAFPRELADAGRAIPWWDTGCDPDDPTTWKKPVIRLGYYEQAPFRTAVNTPVLHAAFDRLVGKG